MAVSKSDWVSFLDADDFFCPHRFVMTAQIIEKNEHIDGVYEMIGTAFENAEAEMRWDGNYASHLYGIVHDVPPTELFDALLWGKYGYFSTIGFCGRRASILKVGGFDEKLRRGQDSLLWLQLALSSTLVRGSVVPVSVRWVHQTNRFAWERIEKLRLTKQVLSRCLMWVRHRRDTPAGQGWDQRIEDNLMRRLQSIDTILKKETR